MNSNATAPSIEVLAQRLASIRSTIATIERPWSHTVEIVAVTKGFGPEAVTRAVAAGCRSIGENYAQEMIAKRDVLEHGPADVHFIGHLQSNKVRQLATLVDVWSTLDRRSVIDEVARRAPRSAVFIQVNATGEDAKSGCSPADVTDLVEASTVAGLDVRGLMTIGPTNGDPVATASAFELTRRLVDDHGLHGCSMGMSGDLELAVRLGATQVRLGTVLFGPRPAKSADG